MALLIRLEVEKQLYRNNIFLICASIRIQFSDRNTIPCGIERGGVARYNQHAFTLEGWQLRRLQLGHLYFYAHRTRPPSRKVDFFFALCPVAKRRQRLWHPTSLLVNTTNGNCKKTHRVKILFRFGKEPCNKRDDVYYNASLTCIIYVQTNLMVFRQTYGRTHTTFLKCHIYSTSGLHDGNRSIQIRNQIGSEVSM